MHFLKSVKRKFSLSRETQAYLKKNTISHTKRYGRKPKKEIMIGLSKTQQTKQKKSMAGNKLSKFKSALHQIKKLN